MLQLAAIVIVLTALAHTVLGERFIIARLMRRDLPRLFGDDSFTKRTLRFAWHVTTVAWLLFAWLIVTVGAAPDSRLRTNVLGAIAVAAALTALLPLVVTRGRHLSWVAFVAVALLVWFGR